MSTEQASCAKNNTTLDSFFKRTLKDEELPMFKKITLILRSPNKETNQVISAYCNVSTESDVFQQVTEILLQIKADAKKRRN